MHTATIHAFAILLDGSLRSTADASHDAAIVSLQAILAVAEWIVAALTKSTKRRRVIVARFVRQRVFTT